MQLWLLVLPPAISFPSPTPVLRASSSFSFMRERVGRGKGSFSGFPCSAFVHRAVASKDTRGRKGKRPIQQVGKQRLRNKDGAGRAPGCRFPGAPWGWSCLEQTEVVFSTSLEFLPGVGALVALG